MPDDLTHIQPCIGLIQVKQDMEAMKQWQVRQNGALTNIEKNLIEIHRMVIIALLTLVASIVMRVVDFQPLLRLGP